MHPNEIYHLGHLCLVSLVIADLFQSCIGVSSVLCTYYLFLEYAGELRIIVLKGEEESYIDSHTDTLKTHTKTHTSTHAQGKQKLIIYFGYAITGYSGLREASISHHICIP